MPQYGRNPVLGKVPEGRDRDGTSLLLPYYLRPVRKGFPRGRAGVSFDTPSDLLRNSFGTPSDLVRFRPNEVRTRSLSDPREFLGVLEGNPCQIRVRHELMWGHYIISYSVYNIKEHNQTKFG